MERGGFKYQGPVLNAELGLGISPQANFTRFCFSRMLRQGAARWWSWVDFFEQVMFKSLTVCTGVTEKISFNLMLREEGATIGSCES